MMRAALLHAARFILSQRCHLIEGGKFRCNTERFQDVVEEKELAQAGYYRASKVLIALAKASNRCFTKQRARYMALGIFLCLSDAQNQPFP
jgi:hypothetical protein